jgi:hypothetical protein
MRICGEHSTSPALKFFGIFDSAEPKHLNTALRLACEGKRSLETDLTYICGLNDDKLCYERSAVAPGHDDYKQNNLGSQ